jgi:heptosyltransferase-2/heptosyltransferase-3
VESGRPLVVRVAALGDTILATAMVRAVAERWQQPCDVVVHSAWADSVMTGLDSVGEVVGLSSRTTPYRLCPSQWRLVRWLRDRGPGPTYVIDKRHETLRLLARGGVPREWTVSSFDAPWRERQHHVDHLLEVVRYGPAAWPSTPAEVADSPPHSELWVSDEERGECRRWLEDLGWRGEPLLVVQTQSRKRSRGSWPAERWQAAIGRVLERLEGGLAVLIGAPSEAASVQRIADRFQDLRVINAAPYLPLRQLFALLERCHSCLSLDTGPAHAAAALGRPVVVLICDTHPEEYRPVGAGARVAQVCALPREAWPDTQKAFERVHRTQEIEVDQVVEAWLSVTETQ